LPLCCLSSIPFDPFLLIPGTVVSHLISVSPWDHPSDSVAAGVCCY
jgi:hypothetical protein